MNYVRKGYWFTDQNSIAYEKEKIKQIFLLLSGRVTVNKVTLRLTAGNNMKETDCVGITVEKEKYAKNGVHNGYWLVNIPQCDEKEDIATLSVHETDMKVVPVMHATVNE